MKHEQTYSGWDDKESGWPYRRAGFIVNPKTGALEWAVVEVPHRERTPEEQTALDAWSKATNLWGQKPNTP